MDIRALRAMRTTDLSKISTQFDQEANPESGTKSYKDDRFWKPVRDKAGNASATIRFLSRTEGDDLPWVKLFSHGFQGPGGRWYIDNCPTTLEGKCPVCELNTALWNSTADKNHPARKQASVQKRKLSYIANVLIVSDPKAPENNGKVMLFKFGKKIFDKIMDKARPTFEDEAPVNVFDYWDGANFKLKMKTVDKMPNYDSSTWDEVSQVADTDEEILEIVKNQIKLSEFVDAKNFKSYDDLKKKLESTMNGTVAPTAASLAGDDTPMPQAQAPRVPVWEAQAPRTKPAPADDDDDDLSYFQSLANQD